MISRSLFARPESGPAGWLPAALVVAVLLGACATPPPRLPQAVEQAQMADQDARRALRAGNVERARLLFTESLRLHRTLDDSAGSAGALLSLAALAHRQHEDDIALNLLDQVLLERQRVYPPELMIEAAFRKAVILTGLGRREQAATLLAQAGQQCARKCALQAGITVLHARLALLDGDANDALKLAQPVAADKAVAPEERANALRIIAAAEAALQRPGAALQHYQAALALDKPLGLGARIEQDLNGIAHMLTALGRNEEAAAYARRATLVHEALRADGSEDESATQ